VTPDDIRRWREERGLSQADLARLLGVRQATVSRWESGDRPPTLPLVRLALERLGQKIRPKRPADPMQRRSTR
jgi:transcriptional regulator with XRE-family HTH domain